MPKVTTFLQGPNASNKSRQSRRYAEVMRRLVSRYIHQAKKQHRQDGVNEDDLLEIKQDISSLRYELREDRKREAARAYGQMDAIKKDIIKLIQQNNKNGGTPSSSSPKKSHENTTQVESSDSSNAIESHSDQMLPYPSCTVTPVVSPTTAAPLEGDLGMDFSSSSMTCTASNGRIPLGQIQTQQTVDLGMLGRDPTTPPSIDITVTPATSLPNNIFTYSQGNLSGCLLAPQEMDYLRKEIVRSLRVELRDMLKDALCKVLSPTAQTSAPNSYSPTPTPTPTPNLPMPSSSSLQHSQQGGKTRKLSYSRAPTVEAPSSPLLSPTSSTLRVPHMSCGPPKDLSSLHTSAKNLAASSGLSTSNPVLLCPGNESEHVYKQMYTQI